jgi:chromosome partitioning protein
MSHAVPNILLTIQINEAQLGYLSSLYPEEDPEEALVKFLECDRLRALRRAERKVRVLHSAGDGEGDHAVNDYFEHIFNFLESKKFLSCPINFATILSIFPITLLEHTKSLFMLIGILNQKGGVGKTTTAVHLTYWLFSLKRNVLVIDADSQKSSSKWLERVGLQYEVIDDPELVYERAIELSQSYDEVVIDAPGVLGDTTKSILLAVDLALIPVQPTQLDIDSTEETLRIVRNAQHVRKGQPRAAIFLNRAEKRSVLYREAQEVLRDVKGVELLNSTIYRRTVIADAPGQGSTVFGTAGESAKIAAKEYEALFKEAIEYGAA